jgi:hypothetical protein
MPSGTRRRVVEDPRLLQAQARWLFDFGRADLAALGLEQRHRFAFELERWINVVGNRHWTRPMAIVEENELNECHEWLSDGLQRLARGAPWDIQYVEPPRYTILLTPPSLTRYTGVQHPLVPLKQIVVEDAVPIFLRHLRVCERPKCGSIFWREGRGRFCSARCGGRVRTAAWRRDHPQEARTSRRKSYVKRQKAKTSNKVQVAHRPRRSGHVDAAD